MKNKKKLIKLYSIIGIFVISIFVTNVLIANALPIGNKSSFSVGAKYSDGDSTGTALYASNTYWDMGMQHVVLLQSPTITALNGSHTNGMPYLQSGIVFINGHADSDRFEFPNGIYIMNNTELDDHIIGIGRFDNSKTALYVMAGCKSAANPSSNITRYVVDQGAKIAMGWSTNLNQASFVNWNKRFHDKIKDNETNVVTAAVFASNFIYLNNNVKNWVTYGLAYNNPWDFINGTAIVSTKMTKPKLEENEYIVKEILKNSNLQNNIINGKEIKAIAEEYIKNQLDSTFNPSDYLIEINGTDTKFYDYVLNVDGIRTNIGYTIVQEKSGRIRLFDNRNNYNINKIKDNIDSISHKTSYTIAKATNDKALQNIQILNNNYSTVEVINETPYYDVEEEKLYYATTYKTTTKGGASSMNTYLTEIK